ncbi:MAG TPA: hypothetical protein VMN36_16060 [Verrucomicrobiales bacterium]|nr:hypothetical protein [Verrucomicrobiales bacterium]
MTGGDAQTPSEKVALVGYAYLSVDSKSRLTIPARWRDPGMTLLYGFPHPKDPTLRLMPPEYWKVLQQKIDASTELRDEARAALKEQLFGSFVVCPMDSQGRVLLPKDLPEKYRKAGEVVLVADSNRISMWRVADWEARKEQQKEDFVHHVVQFGL